MQKNKVYWTYLIDNFERDLAGISWWVNETSFHKGNKVCLLPTTELTTKYLLNERPDIIVWNYARNNNIELIKISKYLGIFNIVHDTEGIPYESKFFYNIKQSYFKYIDEIWCWGKSQRDILINKTLKLRKKPLIKNTGCIRYEYIKTLNKINLEKNLNKVVWNTNYASLDPRYQSAFKEYRQVYKLHKYFNEEDSFELFLKFASRRQNAYEFVKNLFLNSRNLNLTIRPHPFESIKFYRNCAISKYKKVKISKGKDINYDLERNSLVIQNGCQTVLESFIRGIPSIKTTNEKISIWSDVTPFYESKELKNKINKINFLNEVYSKQKDLFKIKKINLLLNNLFKDIKITNTHNLYRKEKNINFLRKFYLSFVKIKIIIKDLIKTKSKLSNKNDRKISTVDIDNFIYKKYKLKSLVSKQFCIFYP